MEKQIIDKKKFDTIFIVIMILIALTIVYIVFCSIFMCTHELTQVEATHMQETQKMLGIGLVAQLLGGFAYQGSKNFSPANKDNQETLTSNEV